MLASRGLFGRAALDVEGAAVRPFIMLDLDGVLNPFAAPSCPPGYDERVFFDGEEPVRYCTGHATWILELAAAGELWWATGWGQEANDRYLPVLGLDPLPVVRFPPVPFEPALKVPAVAAVAGSRPVAWIDDNHTPQGHAWASARSAPTLLVQIDPSIGWTRPDVEHVLGWANTVSL